jgi:hypothetical protein
VDSAWGNPPPTNVAQVGATDSPGSAVSGAGGTPPAPPADGAGIHVAQVTSPGDNTVGNPPDFNIINRPPSDGSPTVVAMNPGSGDAGGPIRVPTAFGGSDATSPSDVRAPSTMVAGVSPLTGGAGGAVSPVGSGGSALA